MKPPPAPATESRPPTRPPKILPEPSDKEFSLPFGESLAPPADFEPLPGPEVRRRRFARFDPAKTSVAGKSIRGMQLGDELMMNLFDDLVVKARVTMTRPALKSGGTYFCGFGLVGQAIGDGGFGVDEANGRFEGGFVQLYIPKGYFQDDGNFHYVIRPLDETGLVVIEESGKDLRGSLAWTKP